MKFRKISLAAVAIAAISITSNVAIAQSLAVKASGTKKVVLSDRVGKNQFEWHSDAPLEQIHGTAEGVTGTITLDPKNLKTLKGTISAEVATMKSGNTTRDEHIRAASWLDAAKHPRITFTTESVSGVKTAGNKVTANVTGNFTMHGVTKKVTVPMTLQYMEESAKTRERAPGDLVMLTADFNISLKDFNIEGSKGSIGSKVGEKIKITAKLFGSTGI